MGVRFEREKPRHPLLWLAYQINRILPLSQRRKLDFYLDLEWIAQRLAIEASHNAIPVAEHPFRSSSFSFIAKGLRPTDRVLDLGCARGEISRFIAGHAKEVVGVDHNPKLIEIAENGLANLSYVCADARNYLATSPRFDVLILSHVLEHIDQPEAFLQTFRPHFERIYIEVPDFEGQQLNPLRTVRGRSLVYSDNDHIAEFDRDEMRKLISGCGLAVTDEDYRGGVMRFWCG